MPRCILTRPRNYGLSFADRKKLAEHKLWEDFSNWTYFIGGILFVIGSVFFLPQYEEHEPIGSWIYVVASALYLMVSMHDLVEVHAHVKATTQRLLSVDFIAAITYILGSILFILGSIFFLPNIAKYDAGAWTFITGSIMFVFGALNNGLQSYESNTKLDSQYLLISAMSYIVGSTMFLVASVPYLFVFDTDNDQEETDTFLAAIYITGSLCFLLGGIVNFLRSKLMEKAVALKLQQDDDAQSKAVQQADSKSEPVEQAAAESIEQAAAASEPVEQAASKSESDEC